MKIPSAPICRSSAATLRNIAKRETEAKRSRAAAADILAPLWSGAADHVFALTGGQASQIDLLLAAMDGMGQVSEISVWTWAIADYELVVMSDICARAAGLKFRLIVDRACVLRQPAFLAWFGDRFGLASIRATISHAKIATVRSADGRVCTIRGSMNLNNNPRCEQLDACVRPEVYAVVRAAEDELFSGARELTKSDLQYTKCNAEFERIFGGCDSPKAGTSKAAQPRVRLDDIATDW